MFKRAFFTLVAVIAVVGFAVTAMPTTASAQGKAPPGYWTAPGSETAVRVGGFARVWFIYDLDGYSNDARMFPQFVPRPGRPVTGAFAAVNGEGDEFFADSRHSRIYVRTSTPTAMGTLKTHVEGDFYGTTGGAPETGSASFRRRHAYGSLGKWLFGWTWSTFMDLRAYPESITIFGPVGIVFVRQAQVRFTQPMGKGSSFSVAIEHANKRVNVTPFFRSFDQFPDVIASYITAQPWGHVMVAGMARFFQIDDSTATPSRDATVGWGAAVSTTVKTMGKDKFQAVLGFGDGIGEYISAFANLGMAAVANADGKLETISIVGGYVSYTHWWNATTRSSLMIGGADARTKDFQPASTAETMKGGEINIVWSPVKSVNIGLAAAIAEREDKDGLSGENKRIAASFQLIY